MVSEELQREIAALIREIGEPLGRDVERRSLAVQREIQRDYLPQALEAAMSEPSGGFLRNFGLHGATTKIMATVGSLGAPWPILPSTV